MSKRFSVALAAVAGMTSLFADTYYWLPEKGVKADATDLNNWSIAFDAETKTPVPDAHPTRLPTASDALCACRDFHFDFGGKSLSFKTMSAAVTSPYTGSTYWGESGLDWIFENGTYTVETLSQRIRTGDVMLLTNSMHLVCTSWFTPGSGMGGDGVCDVDIADGCSLQAKNVAFSNGRIHVAPGATFEADMLQNSGAQPTPVLENRGTTTLKRVDVTSGASGDYKMTIRQIAGTMTFGGAISRNGGKGKLVFEVSGGTLRSSGQVSFADVTSAAVASDTALAVQVDEGGKLDFGAFTFGDNVSVSLTGPGETVFGAALPEEISVAAGGALVPRGATFADKDVSVAAGGVVRFVMPDAVCRSIEYAEGADATIDAALFAAGDTVLRSESDATLDATLAFLEAHLAGTAFQVAKTGYSLVLEPRVEASFDVTSGLPLTDPNGWSGGKLPSAGADVLIRGAGTVELAAGGLSFGKVSLKDGATLKVTGGSEVEPHVLPAIDLPADTALTVAFGAYVCYTNNALNARATAERLPVVTVESGATLYAAGLEKLDGKGGVSNDIVFKNVDLRVYGSIVTPIAAVPSSGGEERIVTLWLGTAEPGETAYFAFTGEGGSIQVRNYSWTYQHGYVRLCCPQPGGIVETPRTLVFKDFSFPLYNGTRTINAFFAGINNTAATGRMRVEAENTVFDVSDTSQVGGNADFVFSKGGMFKRLSDYFLFTVGFKMTDTATVSLGDGSQLQYGRVGPTSSPGLTFNSAGALTLGEGSTIRPWVVAGSRASTLHVTGASRWELGGVMSDGSTSAQATSFTGLPTPAFTGFRDVVLDGRAVLEFVGISWGWGSREFCRNVWGRALDIARDVPMTGAGSIRVSNEVSDDTMTVTVLCSSNTATGTASASADQRAKLLFADGANWAGAVVANGCAALTNVTASGAAKASFGSVAFDGTFPIRVWKQEGVVTGDGLDLASAVSGKGAFEIVPQTAADFEVGDGYDFGTYPANAALPRAKPAKWRFEARPTADEDVVALRLVYDPRGLVLMIR